MVQKSVHTFSKHTKQVEREKQNKRKIPQLTDKIK